MGHRPPCRYPIYPSRVSADNWSASPTPKPSAGIHQPPAGPCATRTSSVAPGCPALKAAGLPSIHFHDLRHTGNKITADAGANLRELMERMGHSSTKAALVYLHSTSERQHAIADAVNKQAKSALRKAKADTDAQGADATSSAQPSGTKVARRRGRAS